jgi:hypothetical protein
MVKGQGLTEPEKRHHAILRRLGCVICREFYHAITPPSIHHIAEGSGLRSEWMTAPLCYDHHQGPEGFHSAPKVFLRVYRLPTEYHLLLLVNKFRAEDKI